MNETKDKNKKHHVFVYGTLRRKDEDGNIIPATHKLYGYAMYNYGPFPYIEEKAGTYSVVGNIIEVDDKELEWLDVYEGLKRKLYKRATEVVEPIEGGSSLAAFVYVADEISTPLVPTGDWADV